MLKLPTNLNLDHFRHLPKTIEVYKQVGLNNNIVNNQKVPVLVKSYLPVVKTKTYPPWFARAFLLIKINSLAKKQCQIDAQFVKNLAEIYNKNDQLNDIFQSSSQSEVTCQFISKIKNNLSISVEQFNNIIQGNALLAASVIYLMNKCSQFLKKQQIAFCLSFVSLGGREIAFIPIVHQDKNHAGQIFFAKRVSDLFYLQKKPQKQQIKVQDPYSMRCSPQVHGIAYDCYEQLNKSIQSLINKPHHKNITIKGKFFPNLLLESDTFSLKADSLICCIQQIGAMSFLRTQRILNSYLGKNKLKQRPEYTSLFSMMKTALTLISKNKILCQMTNFDTCSINSYINDIYYNPGSCYNKTTQLFDNLYFAMTIQILSSLQALKDAYNGHLQSVVFVNQQMNQHFKFLHQNLSPWDKADSLEKVKHFWKI